MTAFLHKEAPVFVQLATLEIRTGCAQGGTSRLECPRPPPCEGIETQWLEDYASHRLPLSAARTAENG